MAEAELIRRTESVLGKSFEEVPCYDLLAFLVDPFPPVNFKFVEMNWLQAGDMVSFDDQKPDVYSTIGVYLGGNKVVVSLPKYGVRLIPYRFVRQHFLWGGRNG